MYSENIVIIAGNVTRPIELRQTRSSTAVTDMSLAINEEHKNASGEVVEETTFVDVTIWGNTAEYASKYIGVSDTVQVVGKLKLDTWESGDGEKRAKLKVVAHKIQIVKKHEKGDANV